MDVDQIIDSLKTDHLTDGYYERKRLIAHTIIRCPDEVQEKVLKEVTFVTIGDDARGFCTKLLYRASLHECEKRTIGNQTFINFPVTYIVLNFSIMENDNEEKQMNITAHEIAHFILDNTGANPDRNVECHAEKDTDDLIVKWGFGRAYDNYKNSI